MNKIRATVSGRIQNVGYRAKVIGIAKDFGLTGFVQNLDDGRVRIIAESKKGDFGKFLDAIRIKNTLIDVTDVEVEHADATGDFADFYKLVGGGETDERLDKASDYLKEMIDVMRAGFGSLDSKMDVMIDVMRTGFGGLDSKMDAMLEKQDMMVEKQSETTEEIRGGFESLDSEMDVMIDETRGLREDMKGYMDKKFGKIEGELDLIKGALKERGILC
uniref:acylphosphatase n=1 Tax=Candidatus Methanogaster sp. ANME-2c ERB4 TaxID=2759911 RepID=A0A7G9YL34_9EURY|nr:acylphosphatase [Methanosarcinales archaeon ANME-2c ERB4]